MYDPKKTLLAMGKDLLHTSVGVTVMALAVYFADPEHLKPILTHLPAATAALAGSAISAGLQNWLKNRNVSPTRRVEDRAL